MLLGKAYSDWGHVSDAVAVYDTLISRQQNDFRGYLAKVAFYNEEKKKYNTNTFRVVKKL